MTTTATKTTCTATSLELPCPKCGESGAMWLDLNGCHDETENSLRCQECEYEFTIGEIRLLVEKWSKLLIWLDSFPR